MIKVFWVKHETDASTIGVQGSTVRNLLGKKTAVSDKSSTTFLRTDKPRPDIVVGADLSKDIESITDGVPKWKK